MLLLATMMLGAWILISAVGSADDTDDDDHGGGMMVSVSVPSH